MDAVSPHNKSASDASTGTQRLRRRPPSFAEQQRRVAQMKDLGDKAAKAIKDAIQEVEA